MLWWVLEVWQILLSSYSERNLLMIIVKFFFIAGSRLSLSYHGTELDAQTGEIIFTTSLF